MFVTFYAVSVVLSGALAGDESQQTPPCPLTDEVRAALAQISAALGVRIEQQHQRHNPADDRSSAEPSASASSSAAVAPEAVSGVTSVQSTSAVVNEVPDASVCDNDERVEEPVVVESEKQQDTALEGGVTSVDERITGSSTAASVVHEQREAQLNSGDDVVWIQNIDNSHDASYPLSSTLALMAAAGTIMGSSMTLDDLHRWIEQMMRALECLRQNLLQQSRRPRPTEDEFIRHRGLLPSSTMRGVHLLMSAYCLTSSIQYGSKKDMRSRPMCTCMLWAR